MSRACLLAVAWLGIWLAPAALAQFDATGWVRVERVGERYTFVDADGQPFFSAGANHAQLFLFLRENNREATVRRYGNDLIDPKTKWFDKNSAAYTRLIDAQIDNLKNWKFNTFGYHTDAAICDRMPDDVFFIATFQPIKSQSVYHQLRDKELRPDPFDPAFAATVDPIVKQCTDRFKHRRNLIGYAWTDGFDGRLLIGWAHQMRSLPAEAPAKKVWLEILRKNHPDAASAAKAHRVSAATWEELAAQTRWNWPAPPTADETEFRMAIVGQYYSVVAGLCRKHDPNHLVLGDKARHPAPEDIRAAAPHVDVYLFEAYEFGEAGSKLCADHAAIAEKPVLYGDGGFGFRRPERVPSGGTTIHSNGGKGLQFATQGEAGEYFAQTMKDLSNSPYCLGWHYCGFIEEYGDPPDTDPNENGFMNPFGEYDEEYLSHVRPANEAAYKSRAGLRP